MAMCLIAEWTTLRSRMTEQKDIRSSWAQTQSKLILRMMFRTFHLISRPAPSETAPEPAEPILSEANPEPAWPALSEATPEPAEPALSEATPEPAEPEPSDTIAESAPAVPTTIIAWRLARRPRPDKANRRLRRSEPATKASVARARSTAEARADFRRT